MKITKAGAVLGFTLILSAVIAFWGIKYNVASITVTGASPFKVATTSKSFDCKTDSCTISLKPKIYTFTISKDGFTSQKTELTLRRGESIPIKYEAFKVPTLTPITEFKPIKEDSIAINSAGDQIFYVDGQAVVTFKNPLLSPEFAVSPNKSNALIWDNAMIPKTFFLVDVTAKNKKEYAFKSNQTTFEPEGLSFISEHEVLLKRKNDIVLYNLQTNEESRFPVTDLTHAIASMANNQIVLISTLDLDKFAKTQNAQGSGDIINLINTSKDTILNKATEANASYKLYYYNPDNEKKFVELMTLPSEFNGQEIRLFNATIIKTDGGQSGNSTVSTLIQAGDKTFILDNL